MRPDFAAFEVGLPREAKSFDEVPARRLVQELNRPGIDSELAVPGRLCLTSMQRRLAMSDGSYNQFCPVAMAAEVLALKLDNRHSQDF